MLRRASVILSGSGDGSGTGSGWYGQNFGGSNTCFLSFKMLLNSIVSDEPWIKPQK